MAHTCLLSCSFLCWRRFVWAFAAFPWCLAILCDPDAGQAEREVFARLFWATAECCLDEFFSLRVYHRLVSWEDLLEPKLIAFLTEVFFQGLPSSSHMEDDLAYMRVRSRMGLRAQHISTHSARHLLKEQHRTWKRLVAKQQGQHRGRRPWGNIEKRPIWAVSKRQRLGLMRETHDQRFNMCVCISIDSGTCSRVCLCWHTCECKYLLV